MLCDFDILEKHFFILVAMRSRSILFLKTVYSFSELVSERGLHFSYRSCVYFQHRAFEFPLTKHSPQHALFFVFTFNTAFLKYLKYMHWCCYRSAIDILLHTTVERCVGWLWWHTRVLVVQEEILLCMQGKPKVNYITRSRLQTSKQF